MKHATKLIPAALGKAHCAGHAPRPCHTAPCAGKAPFWSHPAPTYAGHSPVYGRGAFSYTAFPSAEDRFSVQYPLPAQYPWANQLHFAKMLPIAKNSTQIMRNRPASVQSHTKGNQRFISRRCKFSFESILHVVRNQFLRRFQHIPALTCFPHVIDATVETHHIGRLFPVAHPDFYIQTSRSYHPTE